MSNSTGSYHKLIYLLLLTSPFVLPQTHEFSSGTRNHTYSEITFSIARHSYCNISEYQIIFPASS